MNDAKVLKKATVTKSELKDYTLELPMIDLGEVIKFVTDIHEKALETATMAVVAEKLEYASASSTPFYRRVVAARLFELLTPQGAVLTQRALDYLKPDTAEAKNNALRDSILAFLFMRNWYNCTKGSALTRKLLEMEFSGRLRLTKRGREFVRSVLLAPLNLPNFLRRTDHLNASTYLE